LKGVSRRDHIFLDRLEGNQQGLPKSHYCPSSSGTVPREVTKEVRAVGLGKAGSQDL